MTQRTGSMQVAGPEEAIGDLVRELGNPDEQVRWSAAYVLADPGKPAVEPLIATLRDGDWVLRTRAAQALGRLGDARAAEPLVHLIYDDKPEVRRQAVTALGRVGAARFTEQLASPLHDEDWRVRLATVFVLAKLENKRADALIAEVLADEEPVVKSSARLLVEKRREMGV